MPNFKPVPDAPDLKVGDIVRVIDSIRRANSAPRFQTENAQVSKESATHWTIQQYGRDYLKVPKRLIYGDEMAGVRHVPRDRGGSPIVFLTAQAYDDYVYVETHRIEISDLIRKCKSAETLRRVEALLTGRL